MRKVVHCVNVMLLTNAQIASVVSTVQMDSNWILGAVNIVSAKSKLHALPQCAICFVPMGMRQMDMAAHNVNVNGLDV